MLFYDAEMSAIHRLPQHGRCNVCGVVVTAAMFV